jgi:ferredoxin
MPYPTKLFDISVAAVTNGFLADVATDKGMKFLTDYHTRLTPVSTALLEERAKNRVKVIAKIKTANASCDFLPVNLTPLEFKKKLAARYRDPLWEKHCATCVTCGACTQCCPTCHCFILVDIPGRDKFPKMKYGDSCQYTGYARVAGGANPKKHKVERFQNRYYCKLDYKPDNFHLLACTGCGRCIMACQGKIDIRKVLKDFAG